MLQVMEYKNRPCTILTYLDNKISIMWVTSYIKWLPKVHCTLKIFFWLIKWRLFSWSDTILGHGEALVFYRIFSFTFIIFFKILNFGLISYENSTENRFQSVSVTIKITDNREYRPIFKTLVACDRPTDEESIYLDRFLSHACMHVWPHQHVSMPPAACFAISWLLWNLV